MQVRERKKAQTRETILRVCGDLFRARGFDATSIEEIVTAADISRQTFFNYFDGKDAVLTDLGIAWLEAQATRPREGALAAFGGPVLADMRDAIMAQARAMEADRAFVSLVVMRSSVFARPGGAVGVMFGSVAHIIRCGRAAGEIDASVDAEAAAELIVTALFMTVRLWAGGHGDPDRSLEERMKAALDLLERGLRA